MPAKIRYNSPLPFFHNKEHGGSHCQSEGKHPYKIKMVKGKHQISAKVAIGHGIGNKPVKFLFTEKLGGGYNLASGKPIGGSKINSRVGAKLRTTSKGKGKHK